ncbi:MAG: YcbK family protein [Polyangiaceae bacterium]|jgi:uncharacterized protein YcbK (DUF882 family)
MTALTDRIAAISVAVVCVALFATSAAVEPRVNRTDGLAVKKEEAAPSPPPPPLLGTLVQTHTDERVPLDDATPTFTRFDALLADRATGTSAALDPRLLGLLRTLATKYTTPEGGPPRIELVSGFRSPKLNEMMRKKGHHVASHSQHSLGHACDFRIVVPCVGDGGARGAECAGAVAVAIDPRELERAIRATGWDGGVGIYTLKDDWFVHADVGPNRSWFEGPRGAETAGMARMAE